jgi:hypothetical protein
MYVGIDWAAAEHAVCIVEADGRVVDRFSIAHSAEGFERLVSGLARQAEPGTLPVAIERPDGRLVDRLLEAGHPVVPVKTTAIKAWREAEVGSGAKSDPGDARVIADYLRLRAAAAAPVQRADAGVARRRALAERPRRRSRGRGQPAACRAGGRLARCWRALRRRGQRDRPGLPRALPHRDRRGPPR